MSKNQLAVTTVQFNPALEKLIQLKDAELKELARKKAKHFAKSNLPASDEESLTAYLGEFKTGYEQLGADIMHNLQPANHFPEAKMDADVSKEKDKNLEARSKGLEDSNRHDEYDLANYNPGNLKAKIWIVAIFTLILFFGEVLFNVKAFQILGDNLLFALFISIAVSLGIYLGSHYASFIYKKQTTRVKRITVVTTTFFIVTIVFIVLALLRSKFLATHDIQINPFFFVIMNLFFFIVSALTSYILLPSWEEVKESFHFMGLQKKIDKRKAEIALIKQERETIKTTVLENSKLRLRIIQYSNYASERIRRMYFETVEIFKGTNLVYRTDKLVPACFNYPLPEPNIEGVILTFVSNSKAS